MRLYSGGLMWFFSLRLFALRLFRVRIQTGQLE
jgi:hypothetical protein